MLLRLLAFSSILVAAASANCLTNANSQCLADGFFCDARGGPAKCVQGACVCALGYCSVNAFGQGDGVCKGCTSIQLSVGVAAQAAKNGVFEAVENGWVNQRPAWKQSVGPNHLYYCKPTTNPAVGMWVITDKMPHTNPTCDAGVTSKPTAAVTPMDATVQWLFFDGASFKDDVARTAVRLACNDRPPVPVPAPQWQPRAGHDAVRPVPVGTCRKFKVDARVAAQAMKNGQYDLVTSGWWGDRPVWKQASSNNHVYYCPQQAAPGGMFVMTDILPASNPKCDAGVSSKPTSAFSPVSATEWIFFDSRDWKTDVNRSVIQVTCLDAPTATTHDAGIRPVVQPQRKPVVDADENTDAANSKLRKTEDKEGKDKDGKGLQLNNTVLIAVGVIVLIGVAVAIYMFTR